jgi:restriction endonuclease Mrr
MTAIIRAFPLEKGVSRSEVEEFAQKLKGQHAAETDQFYRGFGVTKESWFFQDGSHGPQVIVYSEIGEVQKAAKNYQESVQDFVVWFKKEVDRLSGVDPNKDPLGPPTEKIFEWND